MLTVARKFTSIASLSRSLTITSLVSYNLTHRTVVFSNIANSTKIHARTKYYSSSLSNDKILTYHNYNTKKYQIYYSPVVSFQYAGVYKDSFKIRFFSSSAKDKNTEKHSTTTSDPVAKEEPVKKLSLYRRFVNELKHYWHGSKLFAYELKISTRLLVAVAKGHELTRRERRQLTRTTADIFRLFPFAIFVIVPFLEFTLPIFLKLFPNMLPSTFKEEFREMENKKKNDLLLNFRWLNFYKTLPKIWHLI